jgi:hypothetical protein
MSGEIKKSTEDGTEKRIDVPCDSMGQNPFYPGDAIKKPGEVIVDEETGEKTIIPLVQ